MEVEWYKKGQTIIEWPYMPDPMKDFVEKYLRGEEDGQNSLIRIDDLELMTRDEYKECDWYDPQYESSCPTQEERDAWFKFLADNGIDPENAIVHFWW